MKTTFYTNRAVITPKRRASNRFSNADIQPAIDLFIQRHPDEPHPELAHSSIKHNVILLKNRIGMVAVATIDGNFLTRIGGTEFDGGA